MTDASPERMNLNEAIRKALASEPLRLARAKELYTAFKRRYKDEIITSDGLVVYKKADLVDLRGNDRALAFKSSAADLLVQVAISDDDRFKATHVELLNGLARVAFQLGVESMQTPQEPADG